MRFFRTSALIILFVGIVFGIKTVFFSSPDPSPFAAAPSKEHIALFVDGTSLGIARTSATTINELLQSLNISANETDFLWPEPEQALFSNTVVTVRHSKTVKLKTSTGIRTIQTTALNTQELLDEQHITLEANDIVLPGNTAPLNDGTSLQIIRVQIEEKTINQPIAFTTTVNEDDSLSWRKKITTQKGQIGNKALTYQIISHDGKEIQRKLLKTEITEPPTQEIVTQGTYVKVGKASTGLGSWYAFTGTLSAASPWLPIGSYVRVTNQDNGKQVIVRINDRGPFGPNRIIDLDKVAFQQIASLGAGVINVKMETIVN